MTRVAIIGAGPCGLSQLRAFASAKAKGADIPEIVCFEKQSEWTGLWNYTWRNGLDANGEPVHGSMYRYLWSNGPKECLEFGDYSFEEHFGKPIPSFPPREVLRDYIVGRAEKSDVRQYVRFDTAVQFVSYSENAGQFTVRSTDLASKEDTEEQFDYVVVATGHFSTPNVPSFEGIDSFPGRIMHSHDYRDAREFKGQRVLVIGASYSAEDVALQTKKYGAESVTISYRTNPMGFHWPEGMEEIQLGHQVRWQHRALQGRQRARDRHRHPVHRLPAPLPVRRERAAAQDPTTGSTPECSTRGVMWIGNPKLMYLGMQDQYYTFTMFDAQAWYARDVILGKIALPSKADMQKDASTWQAREEALGDPLQEIDFQTDYCKDLCEVLDYGLDFQVARDNFEKWEHDKEHSILAYRDEAHPSPVTGTSSPVHHTAWWEAMDDTMKTYLATK